MYLPRILLVEVDDHLRTAIAEMLHQEGYPHQLLCDVGEAMGHLEGGAFDVLLVDPEHGQQEGLALMEAVRARLPSMEIVNLAQSPSVEVTAQALRLGAYDLLFKPIAEMARLRQTLRRVAEKIRLSRQNVLLLRELQSANEGLWRLGQAVQTLTQELFTLLEQAKSRGTTLELGEAYALGLAALSRFAGGREVILLSYDPAGQVLRGEKTSSTERRSLERLELNLGPADRKHFDQIDLRHPVASLLRDYFADEALQVFPLTHSRAALGLLVVRSDGAGTRPGHDAGLLRQFADWLGLLFEQSRLHKALLDLSAIDGLTGLYNHRFFQDRLAAELARATRHGHPVSLLFCDLDDFKRYNDENGHAAGDLVLQEFGRLLSNTGRRADLGIAFRESDVVARYGGEEFVIVLPETSAAGAMVKAERLRQAVARLAVGGKSDGMTLALTVSIGVAEFPRDASDKNELIDAADRAMYAAKRAGKNRVTEAERAAPPA